MRYRIVAWTFPEGMHVIITETDEFYTGVETNQHSFFVRTTDLKLDDLQHFLEDLYRQVSETTL